MTNELAELPSLAWIAAHLRKGYETVLSECAPDRILNLLRVPCAKQAPETKANQPSLDRQKHSKESDPREAVIAHLPDMRAFAMSMARNHALADDLVQDTIVKAWENFDKFDPDTNLRAWLFTILRNTYFSHCRKRQREVTDAEGIYASQLAIRPDHDGRLQLRDFRAAFNQLPPAQRESLVLVGAFGFTYEEAAEMSGVPLGTLKSRVNRGRKALAAVVSLKEGEAWEVTDATTLAALSAPGIRAA